ncbi:MAG: FAD binding domain-containing protein [Acidobacteriota bacterium]
MKPAPFQYHAPETVEEALALLAEHGDEAKLLAGGQSLVPTMNFRLAQPAVIVDLNRIGELSYIQTPDATMEAGQGKGADKGQGKKKANSGRAAAVGAGDAGDLCIGAMTRQAEVERSPLVAQRAPLLHETMPHIAHLQIRNRGTIGGSLAHADPAAELPAVMTALDARFLVRGQGGERWVAAGEFFQGLFATALAPDELLAEVVVPQMPPGNGWAFREVARRHGDYALVGVAALVALAGRRCEQVRVVCLGVGSGPVRAGRAEGVLVGQQPSEKRIREAAEAAADAIEPGSDIHASARYRRHLARVLVDRALAAACRRAGESTEAPPPR